MKILQTPTREDRYAETSPFNRMVRVNTPASLVIKDGVGEVLWYPRQTDLEVADFYFLGGHEHPLTDAEVAAITAAGFGDLITDVP